MSFVVALVFTLCAPAHAQSTLLGQVLTRETPAEDALASLRSRAAGIDASVVEGAAVQHGGRAKPFDSFARETLLFINGRYSRWGLSSTQIYLALMLSPGAPAIEWIELRDSSLREALGLREKRRFVSMAELERAGLEAKAEPLLAAAQMDSRRLTTAQKSWLELYHQHSLLRSVISGEHLSRALDFSQLLPDGEVGDSTTKVRDRLVAYLRALVDDPGSADAAARELVAFSRSQNAPDLFRPQLEKIGLEVFYNRARIFFWNSIMYLVLGFLFLLPESRRRVSGGWGLALIGLPLVVHVLGLALRVHLTGFAPITNMYGTMIWVSFGVNLFGLLLYRLYGNAVIIGTLLLVSGLVLFLAQSFPLVLSPDLDPIVAVLRSNFWLSTHVTSITISYAALTIAMVLGNLALVRVLFGSRPESFVREYELHAYRAVQLGCFLLTVGIILGGVWADYSWGRFWGWDPKETWALIADLAYLALLHARYQGWARGFVFLALSPIAYLTVIMAWYGVNFILATGLHSYGFSSGGTAAVIVFVSLQVALLAAGLARFWLGARTNPRREMNGN